MVVAGVVVVVVVVVVVLVVLVVLVLVLVLVEVVVLVEVAVLVVLGARCTSTASSLAAPAQPVSTDTTRASVRRRPAIRSRVPTLRR